MDPVADPVNGRSPAAAHSLEWERPSRDPAIRLQLAFRSKLLLFILRMVVLNLAIVLMFTALLLISRTFLDNAKLRAKSRDDLGRADTPGLMYEPRLSGALSFASDHEFRFHAPSSTDLLEEYFEKSKNEKHKDENEFQNLWDYSAYQLLMGTNKEETALDFIAARLDARQLSQSHLGLVEFLHQHYVLPCDAYFIRNDFAKCRVLIARAAGIMHAIHAGPSIVHNDYEKRWTNFHNLVLLLDALFERSELFYFDQDSAWRLYHGVYARFGGIWSSVGEERYKRQLQMALLRDGNPLAWKSAERPREELVDSSVGLSRDDYDLLVLKEADKLRERYVGSLIDQVVGKARAASPPCLQKNAFASWDAARGPAFYGAGSKMFTLEAVAPHVRKAIGEGGGCDARPPVPSMPEFSAPPSISGPPLPVSGPPLPIVPPARDQTVVPAILPSMLPLPGRRRAQGSAGSAPVSGDVAAYDQLLLGIDALRAGHFDAAAGLFQSVTNAKGSKLAEIGVLDLARCAVLSAQLAAQREPGERLSAGALKKIATARGTVAGLRSRLKNPNYLSDLAYYESELAALARGKQARRSAGKEGSHE